MSEDKSYSYNLGFPPKKKEHNMGYIRGSLVIGISIIVSVLIAAVYMQNTTRFEIKPAGEKSMFLFDKKTTVIYSCNESRCKIISNYPLDEMKSQGFPPQGISPHMFLPTNGSATLIPQTNWSHNSIPPGLPGSVMPLHPFHVASADVKKGATPYKKENIKKNRFAAEKKKKEVPIKNKEEEEYEEEYEDEYEN